MRTEALLDSARVAKAWLGAAAGAHGEEPVTVDSPIDIGDRYLTSA